MMQHLDVGGASYYVIPEAEFRDKLGIEPGPAMWRTSYDFANHQVIVTMDTDPPSRPWNILYNEETKETGKDNNDLQDPAHHDQ